MAIGTRCILESSVELHLVRRGTGNKRSISVIGFLSYRTVRNRERLKDSLFLKLFTCIGCGRIISRVCERWEIELFSVGESIDRIVTLLLESGQLEVTQLLIWQIFLYFIFQSNVVW